MPQIAIARCDADVAIGQCRQCRDRSFYREAMGWLPITKPALSWRRRDLPQPCGRANHQCHRHSPKMPLCLNTANGGVERASALATRKAVCAMRWLTMIVNTFHFLCGDLAQGADSNRRMLAMFCRSEPCIAPAAVVWPHAIMPRSLFYCISRRNITESSMVGLIQPCC